MIQVKIYTKPDCHLCDEAKEVLRKTRKRIDFILEEIDITGNKMLFEIYKEQIPVVFINEKKAFKYHVDPKALKKRLKRASKM